MQEPPPFAAVVGAVQAESVLGGVEDVRIGRGGGERVDRAELERVPDARPRRSAVLRAVDVGDVDDLVHDGGVGRVNDELVGPRVGETAAVQPRPRIASVGRAIRSAAVRVGGVDRLRIDRVCGDEADPGAQHSLALQRPRRPSVPAGCDAVEHGDVEPVWIVRIDVHPADVPRAAAAERLDEVKVPPRPSPVDGLVDLVRVVHVQRPVGPLRERPPSVVRVEAAPVVRPRPPPVAGVPRVADALRAALVVDVVETGEDQVRIVIGDQELSHTRGGDRGKGGTVPRLPPVRRVVEAVRLGPADGGPVLAGTRDGDVHDLVLRKIAGGVAPRPPTVVAGVQHPPFGCREKDVPVSAVVDPDNPVLGGDDDRPPRSSLIRRVKETEVTVGGEDPVRRRDDVGDPLADSGIRDVPCAAAVGAPINPGLLDRGVDDSRSLDVDGDTADRPTRRPRGLLPPVANAGRGPCHGAEEHPSDDRDRTGPPQRTPHRCLRDSHVPPPPF